MEGSQPAGLDFEGLVEAYYAALYRFAMGLTRTETEACDLVQETFLIWAEKGGQLNDPSKAKGWLFTTLHRRFLDTQRRLVRFPHLEIEAASAELPVIEANAIERLDGAMALELLSRVDEQYRAAVALFYLEDYSYPEIAGILEIPLGTVKSRIARGLRQLKELAAQGTTASHGKERLA